MARLWTCGFELQSVTAGVEILSVTGTPTISTTVHRAGAAALRINPTAATQYVEQQIDSGTVKRTLHRFYLRITTLPSADCNIYGIGQSGYFPGLLRLKTTGVLTLRDGFTSADIGTGSAALSTGVWYRIELDYTDVAGTAGSFTGAFKGYVNGVEFSSTVCSNINGWSRVRIGAQTAVTGEFHIDDVAVNDTTGSVQAGLPGPGNVVHLKPNAAGDNNLFGTAVGGTAGAGNNYTRINETTPNDATSYNETAATGTTTIDDVNLDSSATAGIGAGERVTLVQVGARIGSNAATAASLVYRIKSQAAGTVLESSSVSVALNGWASQKSAAPYVYQLTSYTDPQAGGAWTQALLDTAQIGYRTNVSQATTRRVSTLWALAETVPITTQALTLATETGTAQALARRKTRALGTATETGTAQALAPLAGVPLSALTDTFSDGTVDGAKWPTSYDPGNFTETGGRARVVCNTGYNAFSSAAAYRLRESSVHARVWPPAAGGATAEAWAQILVQTTTLGTDVIAEVNAATGNLVLASRVGYGDAGQVTLTYDPVAHAWLRIRETGGQLLWDTSPDGVTWTNRRTATSPAWVGDTTLQVQLISHRDGGTPDFAEFDSFNTAAGQEAALTPAGETEAAQPLTGRKTRALGVASETDSAQTPGRTRSHPLAPAAESASGQALTRAKTKALTLAADTETAQPLGRRKTKAVGIAGSTNSAQALGRSRVRAIAPATETATAQPTGRVKVKPVGHAGEVASALLLAPASGLQAAEETSTARPLARAKTKVLGTATETAATRPLSRNKTRALLPGVESATSLSLGGGKARTITPAEETWTARPLGRAKARAAGAAGETASALSPARAKAGPLSTASTVETALLLSGSLAGSITTVVETDTGQPLAKGKAQALSPAAEADSARPAGAVKRIALTPSSESASAQALARAKRSAVAAAVAFDEARQLGSISTVALSPAVEISRALIGPKIRIVPAVEQELAVALAGVRQRPADHLDATTSGPLLDASTSGPALTTTSSGPQLAASTTGG
ncbi:hypothetical protein ACJWDR_37520 [Streptomyces tauricus]|uniref:hypothetical protein n=1 Tax=Streptomyces tauricus TaxID=68274 RepID=UPI00387F03C9